MKVACGGCSSIGCGTCGATATTGLLRWRTWWDRFRSLAESSRLRQIRAHDDDFGIRARGGRAPARGEARGLSGAGLLSHAARGQCAVALGMECDATRGVHAEWAVCVRAGGYCVRARFCARGWRSRGVVLREGGGGPGRGSGGGCGGEVRGVTFTPSGRVSSTWTPPPFLAAADTVVRDLAAASPPS